MRHFVQDLENLQTRLLEMGGLVEASIRRGVAAWMERNGEEARVVLQNETRIDQLEMEIDEMAVQLLALQQPMASDLRFITAAIKINTDLERIGDLAASIAERALVAAPTAQIPQLVDIPRMVKLTEMMVRNSLDAFVKRDAELARTVLASDDEVDALRTSMHTDLVELMQRDPSLVPSAVDFLLACRRLERIADHATNVAEDALFVITGEDVRHRRTPKPSTADE